MHTHAYIKKYINDSWKYKTCMYIYVGKGMKDDECTYLCVSVRLINIKERNFYGNC